jgi:hypothetical protein
MEVIYKGTINKECNIIVFIDGRVVIDLRYLDKAYIIPDSVVKGLKEVI